MLRQKLIINIWLLHLVGFLSRHTRSTRFFLKMLYITVTNLSSSVVSHVLISGNLKCSKWRNGILCFVDRASLYNLVNKANLVHNFSYYVYFLSLHVSVDYVPIIRRNNCILRHLVFVTLCEWLPVIIHTESCDSRQPWHLSSLSAPNFRPTATQEPDGPCGNQRYSRELLMIGIVAPETCWAYHKYNKTISSI